MKKIKCIFDYSVVLILSAITALNLSIFVFPNTFAPAGIEGICTMIQDVANVSMGYLALVMNIPILIASFVFLDRSFSFKTTVFVVSFSVFTVLLRGVDLSAFIYKTDTSVVLAPIAAGAIRGLIYTASLKFNVCSGGIDVIAAIVKRKKPYLNFMNIIFVINLMIAFCAYFVYGFKAEPVICSIIYSLITSSVSNIIDQKEHKMVKFEIITNNSDELCQKISDTLHCPSTIINAQGAYSKSDKKMILCVVEPSLSCKLEDLISETGDAVFFKSSAE